MKKIKLDNYELKLVIHSLNELRSLNIYNNSVKVQTKNQIIYESLKQSMSFFRISEYSVFFKKFTNSTSNLQLT